MYASECIHHNELLLLEIIKHNWADKKQNRLRKKDGNLFATEKKKLQSLIQNDFAKEVYRDITKKIDHEFGVTDYDNLMYDLGLLANIFYA